MTMESAPHPAESAPIGHQIEIFEESHEDRLAVHKLEPGEFQDAVDRIGEANNLDLSEGRPVYEGPTPQSADVVTAGLVRRHAMKGLVGAAALTVAIAAGAPGKVAESFKSENTGPIAAEREAAIDRKAKSIVVNSMQGADGPVDVRVK